MPFINCAISLYTNDTNLSVVKSRRSLIPPIHPGQVLTRALKLGLSSVADLCRRRETNSTSSHFSKASDAAEMSIKERWAGTLLEFKSSVKAGQPDASSLAKVEKYLRRAQYLILEKTAARYGNREAKRVRNRYEGTTEYLNAIWNYIGSQLPRRT